MSIKSDRWIKRMCNHPIGMVVHKPNVSHTQSVFKRWYYRHPKNVFTNEETTYLFDNFTFTSFEDNIAELKKRVLDIPEWKPLISPFIDKGISQVDGAKVMSYGVSSYGYDIRCAPEFKVFTNIHSTVVDPKNFDEKSFVDFHGDSCIIPPNSFALARTVEYFRIPRNVLTICLGKSTYARCGIIVNVTPLEPEWEGYVTLEFSNTTPLPAKIYAGEGCAQVLFFESDEDCEVSYADKKGKYQNQGAFIVPAKG